jgi:hypothetical protein
MKKDYCEYCHFKDFTGMEDYGEKPVLQCESTLLGRDITLAVHIEHGEMCLYLNAFNNIIVDPPDIGTKSINYCPMCGEKLNHREEKE